MVSQDAWEKIERAVGAKIVLVTARDHARIVAFERYISLKFFLISNRDCFIEKHIMRLYGAFHKQSWVSYCTILLHPPLPDVTPPQTGDKWGFVHKCCSEGWGFCTS